MRAILYIVFILLVPVASNAVLLIATESSVSMQMTGQMALCLPVLICAGSKTVKCSKSVEKVIERITLLVLLVTLYGCIYQVQFDQNAMDEGKTAAATIENEVIHQLDEAGYLISDTSFCFVGQPGDNLMFRTTGAFAMANDYARFGKWAMKADCTRMSWQGMFYYIFRTNLKFCSDDIYMKMIQSDDVRAMPCFPEQGSITQIENVVLVKISDTY